MGNAESDGELVELSYEAYHGYTWPVSREQRLGVIRLTITAMRHNNTYTDCLGRSDGQTKENRSENIRTQTDRYAELSCRRCIRPIVQRESILRFQGSPSGSLRDAAPAQRRGALNRRHSDQLRRFAPNRLPGSVGVRTSRPEWSASQTPWPQRRTQTFRGGCRVCAGFAGRGREFDDCRLYTGYTRKVLDQSAPTQSGEGAEQKKTAAQSSLESPIPEGTVEAYEELRRHVVQLDGRVHHVEGRGILLRSGLAVWARLRPVNLLPCPPGSHPQSMHQSPVHGSLDDELVRLVAGLILSIQLEDFLHA